MPDPAPLTDRQPVAVYLSQAAGVVAAGLAVAVAFGWLTAEQAGALGVFVGTVLTLFGAILHGEVWAPATVAKLTAPPPEAPPG